MVLKKAYLLIELLVSIAIFTIFALSISYMIGMACKLEGVMVKKTSALNLNIQEYEMIESLNKS